MIGDVTLTVVSTEWLKRVQEAKMKHDHALHEMRQAYKRLDERRNKLAGKVYERQKELEAIILEALE